MTTPATPAPLPAEAVEAAAAVLHDEACDRDAKDCGRWKCGMDPSDRHHALHAGHVEFYRQRAREVLEAAAPHLAVAERERMRLRAWRECEGDLYASIADLFGDGT